jgi:hypothetical protein
MVAQVGYSVAGQSRGRVAPCVVCTWYVETRSAGFLVEPQNQVGFGLSVAPQNRRREVSAGHASRSSNLLGVEASLARVSQSGLKTGGGATTSGARGTITEVASEAS